MSTKKYENVAESNDQIDSLSTPIEAEELVQDNSTIKKKRLDELRDFYKGRMSEIRADFGEPDPALLREQQAQEALQQVPEMPLLSEEETLRVAEEIELEEKYGNTPIGTAARSAAGALTFGLSDVLGKAVFGDEFAERRREEQQRQAAASAIGAAGGIIGGVIGTGGTSLIARGASSGVRAANNAGRAVEQASLQFIREFPNRQIAEGIVGRAAAKAAGWGTEGAIYGGGALVSDLATGRADANAEAVMANIGTGALFGAGMGGAVGGIARAGQKALQSTAKASENFLNRVDAKGFKEIPIIKKGTSKFKEQFDPKIAAEEYSGIALLDLEKLKKSNPQFGDELLTYFQKTIKGSPLDTRKDIFLKNQKVLDVEGRRIGNIIEELSKKQELAVSKSVLYNNAVKKLDDFISQDIAIRAPGSDKLIRRVQKIQKDLVRNASEGDQLLTAKNIQFIKKRTDDLVNWSEKNINKDVAFQMRFIFKDAIDDIASKAGTEAGKALKQANKNFHIAKLLEGPFAQKAGDPPIAIDKALILGMLGFGIYGPAGAMAGIGWKFLGSDLKRSMVMNGQIQAAKERVSSEIGKAMNVFQRVKKMGTTASEKASIIGSGFVPVTSTILLNSNLTKRDNSEKRKLENPKDKREAVENLQDNIERLSTDSDYFESKVLAKFLAMNDAAPSVAAEMINTSRRAVDFLASKLPSRHSANTLIPEKRFLSDTEIAKMARYLQTIENPLSLLQELNRGTLTRDHVEALKAVYPAIYEEIRLGAMEMVQKDPSMNYQAKVQLGILLDLSTDVSLTPENVLKLQSLYAKQANQNEAERGGLPQGIGAVNPTVGALNKLGQGGRMQLSTDRIRKQE